MRLPLLVICSTLLLLACEHSPTSGEAPTSALTPPSTSITPEVDWVHKAAADEWTDLTGVAIDEIGAPLVASVPSDAEAFCPAFRQLSSEGRRAFWISLISAMARFESSFDPSVSFDEKKHCPSCAWAVTRDGRNVVSRGLLQLSQESANGYRGCSVPVADELRLHEPALNLMCGVAIMSKLVSEDGVISGGRPGSWQGGARYWSVLRPGKLSKIQSFTAGTSYCALNLGGTPSDAALTGPSAVRHSLSAPLAEDLCMHHRTHRDSLRRASSL